MSKVSACALGELTRTTVVTEYSCGCDDWFSKKKALVSKRKSHVKKTYPATVDGIEWFDKPKGQEPSCTSLSPKKITADVIQKTFQYNFNARKTRHMSKPNAEAHLASYNVKCNQIEVLEDMVSRVRISGADPKATLDDIVPKV